MPDLRLYRWSSLNSKTWRRCPQTYVISISWQFYNIWLISVGYAKWWSRGTIKKNKCGFDSLRNFFCNLLCLERVIVDFCRCDQCWTCSLFSWKMMQKSNNLVFQRWIFTYISSLSWISRRLLIGYVHGMWHYFTKKGNY